MPREPKTRPTDADVDAFLAAVPDPQRRADALAVAALMREVSGELPVLWGTSIVGYGGYDGPTGRWPIVAFSPRKSDLVLYLMDGFDGRDEILSRLGKHRTGRACLYLRRLADTDPAVLRELVTRSVAAMRAR